MLRINLEQIENDLLQFVAEFKNKEHVALKGDDNSVQLKTDQYKALQNYIKAKDESDLMHRVNPNGQSAPKCDLHKDMVLDWITDLHSGLFPKRESLTDKQALDVFNTIIDQLLQYSLFTNYLGTPATISCNKNNQVPEYSASVPDKAELRQLILDVAASVIADKFQFINPELRNSITGKRYFDADSRSFKKLQYKIVELHAYIDSSQPLSSEKTRLTSDLKYFLNVMNDDGKDPESKMTLLEPLYNAYCTSENPSLDVFASVVLTAYTALTCAALGAFVGATAFSWTGPVGVLVGALTGFTLGLGYGVGIVGESVFGDRMKNVLDQSRDVLQPEASRHEQAPLRLAKA